MYKLRYIDCEYFFASAASIDEAVARAEKASHGSLVWARRPWSVGLHGDAIPVLIYDQHGNCVRRVDASF